MIWQRLYTQLRMNRDLLPIVAAGSIDGVPMNNSTVKQKRGQKTNNIMTAPLSAPQLPPTPKSDCPYIHLMNPVCRGDRLVLFVRHCQSHANVASVFNPWRKWFMPPLCTIEGWIQPFRFGRMMQHRFDNFKRSFNIDITLSNKMYCSHLPRAIATCFGIARGMSMTTEEQDTIEKLCVRKPLMDKIEIQCTACMEEKRRFIEDWVSAPTANTATLESTKRFGRVLKKILNTKATFHEPKTSKCCPGQVCKHEPTGYDKFVQQMYRDFEQNQLTIVVCHGGVIRQILKREAPDVMHAWQNDNLESVMIRYPEDENEKRQVVMHWDQPRQRQFSDPNVSSNDPRWLDIMFKSDWIKGDQRRVLDKLLKGTYDLNDIEALSKSDTS